MPANSQLYSYQAGNTKTLLDDKGELYAFVSDDPSVNDYYDFAPGSSDEISGPLHQGAEEHRHRQECRRLGDHVRRRRISRLPPRTAAGSASCVTLPVGIDGPQWVLEYWSDLNHVFQFVRVEDIAYDKRPGMGNVVYVVDSGRGRTALQTLDTPFRSTNGRVWKMVLDPDNPKKVDSLSHVRRG